MLTEFVHARSSQVTVANRTWPWFAVRYRT